MPDDDNLSEPLDDDKLPGEYPPDTPLGVDEEELTARGEQTDEPLEERVQREEPDVFAATAPEDDPVGPLVAPGGEEGLDLIKESVAFETGGPDPGALDEGDIVAGDSTTRDVATEREGPRSAEEEAMHLTEAPPMGDDGDGYI